ncbi:MAG: threonine synthase [Rickettsiales bacterium]|nr:threonine synthase [Rickettsiales bacterium]
MTNTHPIHYRSTRGEAAVLGFEDAVLAGLATDGGLYVPERLPEIAPHVMAGWAGLPYASLAYEILHPFTQGAVPDDVLHEMLHESYAGFHHPATAPLKQIGSNDWLLELFHGPTLAFKDFALQFLGRLIEFFLARKQASVTVLGATSGDTGSAAIAGCRGRAGVSIVILYPHGRVSEVQRRQMTTVADANVHCLAIEGTFDDCQHIVKTLFVDQALRNANPLVAVNSINWMRILAQVVYYFYAGIALGAPARRLAFSVPTGNFGDIYAGELARRMGLPIERLRIATNVNDILTRTLQRGAYEKGDVAQTLSPSMDIQISSNFERLLYDLHDGDASAVKSLMDNLSQSGRFTLSPPVLARLRQHFDAAAIDDTQTLKTIADLLATSGELIDPHTAIGVAASRINRPSADVAMVSLATAHPAKFPDAVQQATGVHPALPPHMQPMMQAPERFHILPAEAEAVKAYLLEHRA